MDSEGPRLAAVTFATMISGTSDIVAEREMYWGADGNGWTDSHSVFGVTPRGRAGASPRVE